MKNMIRNTAEKAVNIAKNVVSVLRGNITSTSKDGKSINILPLLNSEIRDIMVSHQYGVVSFPYDGLTAIVMQGDGDYILLGMIDKNAPKIKNGESCVYTKFGNTILLKDNGEIEIKTPNCKVDVTSNDILFVTATKSIGVNEICSRLGI